MRRRLPVSSAPEPLEAYIQHFDPLFARRNQRDAVRRYLEGLLLPAERNKTLTALANTEPIVGAQHPRAQGLQWFLSESTWQPEAVNAQRLQLLRADPLTAPDAQGVLVIDESGDRKDGAKTAHVGRQYLANLGKTDNGVVSVSSLWADERVYYPLELEPYTPAHWFAQGKTDPAFRTKPQIAVELLERAVNEQWPFRAVVADAFYGENETFHSGLHRLQLGYVVALKRSHAWWRPVEEVGSLLDVAAEAAWQGAQQPGAWQQVKRTFRDGHAEAWWALEVIARPYGPEKSQRAIVVTTDPQQLPAGTTWNLLTNLPAPGSERAATSQLAPASVEELVRLYGLRMWVEQSYKQVKHALGWAAYQVRSDLAMRRHWALVWCAFSFCWWHLRHGAQEDPAWLSEAGGARARNEGEPGESAGRGEKSAGSKQGTTAGLLAGSIKEGARVVRAVADAGALLASVVTVAATA
jgi:SRSO17 transposase